MTLKTLFPSRPAANPNSPSHVPAANTRNAAGGRAYSLTDESALARFAAAGCLADSFYVSAETNLDEVRKLVDRCSPEFIAQTAIWSRQFGFMKDMPSYLLAALLRKDAVLAEKVAPKVADNGKIIRNVTQILRSGEKGKHSVPRTWRRYVRNYLTSKHPKRILSESVGDGGMSLADVIRICHPKPADEAQAALWAHVCGFPYQPEKAPQALQEVLKWKESGRIEDMPQGIEHRLLEGIHAFTATEWTHLIPKMGWHAIRMNLATFARHGVFSNTSTLSLVCDRLRSEEEIVRSRVWPTQILAALSKVDSSMGLAQAKLQDALQDALEISLKSVPWIQGNVMVWVDVSGSMGSPLTGNRGSSSSSMRVTDVAAVFAAAVLKQNPTSCRVMGVDTSIHPMDLNPRDSILSLQRKISSYGGGGTYLHEATEWMKKHKVVVDTVLVLSDTESYGHLNGNTWSRGAPLAQSWVEWRNKFSPKAQMVCIDLSGGGYSLLKEKVAGAHHIAGFSDAIFPLVQRILSGKVDNMADEIRTIPLA